MSDELKLTIEQANQIIDIFETKFQEDERCTFRPWAMARMKSQGIVEKTKVERAQEFLASLDLQAVRNWCELTYNTIAALEYAMDDLIRKNKKLEANRK